MYKVMLVDDEMWSLEGLNASFDWEKKGFQVIGKYTDSLKAICHIKEQIPDVVFTDIRMPDMTGLEMMREIRKAGLNVEFIIVSGYAEFEYAREAVRQGAYDFLLKPIDLDETDLILDRLREAMDRRRYEEDELLLQHILYEDKYDAGLCPLAACERIQAASVNMAVSQIPFSALWKPVLSAGNLYTEFRLSERKRILLYEAFEKEAEDKWIEHLDQLALGNGYIGISSADTLDNVRILLKEAILASSGNFIGKRTGVTRYTEVINPYYETYGKKICSAILENKYEEACRILDEIAELVKHEDLGIIYIVRLWNQIAILLHENLTGGKRVKIEYLDFFQITRRFLNLESLCQYIKIEIAEILICQKKQIETHKDYNENFMGLLKYVEVNYAKKLNLNTLAEQFYLNMSYCSELFKKVTGLTFSDYVTKIRMEKAAELLSSGNYKIKDVAEMTGYSDAFYFSKVMKKYYGVTPACFFLRSDQKKML